MPALILNPRSATPDQNFQTLQNALKFVEFTPVLVNMGTPSVSRGTYQLCGKVCHIMVYLEYDTDVLWNINSSYMEFPISPTVENITDGMFMWGQFVIPGARLANTPVMVTRVFRGAKFAPIVLPAPGFNILGATGPTNNLIHMSGSYLVN